MSLCDFLLNHFVLMCACDGTSVHSFAGKRLLAEKRFLACEPYAGAYTCVYYSTQRRFIVH